MTKASDSVSLSKKTKFKKKLCAALCKKTSETSRRNSLDTKKIKKSSM